MRGIVVCFALFAIGEYHAQVSVFDCSVIDPAVTQVQIDADDDFHKQCILFTPQENYLFDADDNKTVTASESIHIKENFHSGQFLMNGKMHLKIDEVSPFDVVVMNYPDLKNVELLERFELGVELPIDLYTNVRNFVDDLPGDKINPFLDWEIRVYAEFSHPLFEAPIIIDGFYMKEYNVIMLDQLPAPANGVSYTDQEYKNLGAYEELIDQHNFRIRFAPTTIGIWNCKIHIVSQLQTISSSTFTFNVVDTGNEGYVRAGSNKRFMVIGSGKGSTFMPVGANTPWPATYDYFDPELAELTKIYNSNTQSWGKAPEDYRDYYVTPRVYDKFHDIINSMADGGANLFRFIMYPNSTDIEWEKLGDYSDRLHMAQELDELLELAESRGVYMIWNMQIHYSFQDIPSAYYKRWNWYDNQGGQNFCYRELLNNSQDPIDFFDQNATNNQEARKYYKQRIRYILSRWGYSTNIATFEVLSEISNLGDNTTDNTGEVEPFYNMGNNWQIFTDWLTEMGDYINSHHNGRVHLVTSSYSGEVSAADDVYNKADSPFSCMSSNMYDFAAPSYNEIWIKLIAERHLNEKGNSANSYTLKNGNIETGSRNVKPLIYAETGPEPVNSACREDVTEMNRALWQETFSGLACGLGWDTWTRTDNYEIFGKVKEFISGIEFDEEMWHPGAVELKDEFSPPAWFYKENYANRMVGENKLADLAYLRSGDKNFAIGVITNTSYNVFNVSNCFDSWLDSSLAGVAGYPSPISQSGPINISSSGENLKIKGMRSGKAYVIDYFYPTNLAVPFATTASTGPNLPIDFSLIQNNPDEYIVLFKARWIQESWMSPQFDSVASYSNKEIVNLTENQLATDSTQDWQVKLFPVPSMEKVIIQTGSSERVKIVVTSMDGKLMDETIVVQECELDIRNYEAGSYTVKFLRPNGTSITKTLIKL